MRMASGLIWRWSAVVLVGATVVACSARRKNQIRESAPTPREGQTAYPLQRPLAPSKDVRRQHKSGRQPRLVPPVQSSDTVYNYARILYENGLYDDALREAIRVISFYPKEEEVAEAQLLIGRINYDHNNPKRRPPAALKAWESFLAKYPERPETAEILCLAASCHEEMSQYDEAVLLFGQVTSVFPGSPLADDAGYWHCHCLAKANRTGEAVLHLRGFSDLYPESWDDLFGSRRHLDDDAIELLAELHRAAGDLETTVEILATVPRHEDELDRYWQLQFERAAILQDELEDIEKAAEAFRQILNTCDDAIWREIATAKLARCERDIESKSRR